VSALFFALLVTFLVADSTATFALPRCAGHVELTNAHVAHVDAKTGSVDLVGGRTLHLEGIRLPAGAAGC